MFQDCLCSTNLCNDVMHSDLSPITGDNYSGDVTFVSTLRALLLRRMSKDDHVRLMLNRDPSGTDIRCAFSIPDGTIYILSVNHNLELFDKIENYCEGTDGYRLISKVSIFYKKSFRVLCYVNYENGSVVMFVEDLDLRKWHYLQCSIVAFLPWFFESGDPQKGLTESEIDLIKSLRYKTSNRYKTCLCKIAEEIDVRKFRITQLLSGFEKRISESEIQRLDSKISYNDSRIFDLNRKISELIKENNNHKTMVLGFKGKMKTETESELMEYFIHNHDLFLDEVYENEITFAVKAYCENYDEDAALSMVDNTHADIYDVADNRGYDRNDAKKLLHAIFIEQKLRFKFCAAYHICIGGEVSGIRGYQPTSGYNDCIPNDHINSYACLGQYSMYINECLSRCDYIGAIAQCIASCRSLNFCDSAVMDRFAETFFTNSGKFIELPDGNMVTVIEAIEWLKNKEKELEADE